MRHHDCPSAPPIIALTRRDVFSKIAYFSNVHHCPCSRSRMISVASLLRLRPGPLPPRSIPAAVGEPSGFAPFRSVCALPYPLGVVLLLRDRDSSFVETSSYVGGCSPVSVSCPDMRRSYTILRSSSVSSSCPVGAPLGPDDADDAAGALFRPLVPEEPAAVAWSLPRSRGRDGSRLDVGIVQFHAGWLLAVTLAVERWDGERAGALLLPEPELPCTEQTPKLVDTSGTALE